MLLKNYLKSSSLAIVFILFLTLSTSPVSAQADGESLFKTNCASCHNPDKDLTGPALRGADSRVPSMEWMYKWVRNSAAVIASGDAYANDIYNQYNQTAMTAFPNLSDEEIDAIISYVNNAPVPGADAGGATEGTAQSTSSSWYIYLTIALGIILFITAIALRKSNKILSIRAALDKGEAVEEPIPFYKNKAWIAVIAVVLFVSAGYTFSNYLIGLGRQQNYSPKQPIFYSHKVHVGVNQVNCLYCHSSAEKSKMSMVPSTNVCMNCHAAINEYTGEQLHDNEGKEVDGTAEIAKLYKYAGWDPVKKEYIRDKKGNILAQPIEWVKIHNLPDHVYFNHSQHVNVGEIQCQTCHGDIQNMDEVYQYNDLSMGWCVNCHRTTKVQFDNKSGYYSSIYSKYRKQLDAHQIDSVTVEMIGGTECQKCHY